MATHETVFTKGDKTISVVRKFSAPLNRVWDAWTKSDILDQWWAPKPWKAVTKTQDFREGGYWLYAMTGPEGEKHWSKETYHTIDPRKQLISDAGFCDENANMTAGFPVMNWNKQFAETGDETTVTIEITFDSEAGLEQIVQMGFKEGFTMGLNNLDELLAG